MRFVNCFKLIFVLLVTLSFCSCDPNRIFEENIPVKNEKWDYHDIKSFAIDIQDTAASYNLYVNIRHSFFFDWRNMYVQIETIFPDSTVAEKRVNLPFSEADGKWFGNCTSETCDLQVSIQRAAKFPKKGKYIFKIKQDMRQNPLPKIKNVGLRLEKATKTKPAE